MNCLSPIPQWPFWRFSSHVPLSNPLFILYVTPISSLLHEGRLWWYLVCLWYPFLGEHIFVHVSFVNAVTTLFGGQSKLSVLAQHISLLSTFGLVTWMLTWETHDCYFLCALLPWPCHEVFMAMPRIFPSFPTCALDFNSSLLPHFFGHTWNSGKSWSSGSILL